jgi:hypothetical protein
MLGLEVIILLGFFMAQAACDFETGQIPILLFLFPVTLVAILSWPTFLGLFVPIFSIMALMAAIIQELKVLGKLDPKKPYLGFGDVMAVPLAFCTVNLAFPVLGLAIFGIVLALQTPLFIRKRFIRFIPWLAVPTLLAVLPRLFF